MRILYLSQLIPYPLDAGPKTRMYYVLRYLAAAGHEITLLAFNRPSDSTSNVDHLRSFCTEVYTVPMIRSGARDLYHLARSLLSAQPFLVLRDEVEDMKVKVRDLAKAQTFDAVHADQLWMAPYALEAAAYAPENPQLTLDQHNAMFLIPQRLAESSKGIQRALLQREAAVMRRYEQVTAKQFDHVVWVTAEDQEAVHLAGNEDDNPVQHVIPICVDPSDEPVVERIPSPHRITFLGGLHWPPNAAGVTWFVREIWPLIQAACEGATLTIIGKDPPSDLSAIKGVELTGYVDDPIPYLRETAVFIVPLLAGGGMRVKVLNAWSWGLPVVSTTIGVEGIQCTDEEELLIADEPHDFAEAVARVWHDPSLAARLSQAGRLALELSYDWRTIYRHWNAIYQPVANKGQETA